MFTGRPPSVKKNYVIKAGTVSPRQITALQQGSLLLNGPLCQDGLRLLSSRWMFSFFWMLNVVGFPGNDQVGAHRLSRRQTFTRRLHIHNSVGRSSIKPVTRITFWYFCSLRILMQTERVPKNGQKTNYSQGTFACPCWVFPWLLIRVKADKNPWIPHSCDLRRTVDCTLCLRSKVCVLSKVKGGNSVCHLTWLQDATSASG